MEYQVITAPGIGEASSPSEPVGMLANLTNSLPARFARRQFNWRNQYGPVPVWNGPAYEVNLQGAVNDLVRLVKSSKLPVIGAGYSGGAELWSYVLERLATEGNDQVTAMVLAANPARARTDSAIPGWGISREHGKFPDSILKLYDVANPVDGICCCPARSPLRDLAELGERFSLADPDAWKADIRKKINAGVLFNPTRGIYSLNDWWTALALVRGYTTDGQHTRWYVPKLQGTGTAIAATFK